MVTSEIIAVEQPPAKLCGRCGRPGEFYKNKRSRDGLHLYCKKCVGSYERKSRRVVKPRTANRIAQLKPIDGGLVLRNGLRSRLQGAKHRAKKKNVPFNLTLDGLVTIFQQQGGCCPISGRELLLTQVGVRHDNFENNLSIDRIDPAKGYVIDNVRLVICAVNIAISRRGAEKFYQLCRDVVANLKQRQSDGG